MFSSILTLFALAGTAAAQCSRTELQQLTANYVSARATGGLTGLTEAIYTENFKPANIRNSVFASPLRIDHNRSLLDTTQCATYTEMVVTNPVHPYIIGTQLKVTGGKVTLVESLVTDAGDWLFNATGFQYYATRENWSVIPEAKRDSRAVIQAAADAYLDLWKDKSVKVPWGVPCTRLEGGAYTGRGLPTDSCDVGVPVRIVEMPNRRYVIDEELGAVDVFVTIGGCATGRPDSHEFRLEGGKLRFIHTMTIMDPSCPGLPSQACECRQPTRWF
ncbi:hypothetical protein FA15DRAFT_683338 [Coprinopsis marcescibilis]|uniref:DUF8021 domain-containing protein n=1 Tax=Coprinopsis marcescibilis TaxID=230819 RepID=A0A5C3KDX6_COPMA|nr:hypothetical protein FA15DRAFT_683338 [Coprinopsis marcescibilis]